MRNHQIGFRDCPECYGLEYLAREHAEYEDAMAREYFADTGDEWPRH